MAIVETGVPATGTSDMAVMDFYPSWGPNRWQALGFGVDVVLTFGVPGGAVISGIRRAGYLRKLYRAARSGDKLFDFGRAADKAGDMQLGTSLFVAGMAGSAAHYGSPLHLQDEAFQTVGETVVMYYRDRDGRIRAILPSDRVVNQSWGHSRGDQGVVLPAARRSGGGFFHEDGIQRLSSFKRPRTPIPKWSFTTRSPKGLARGNPLAEGPGSRGRSPPSRRANKITPYCPVHRRRHWCNVTRGKT